MNQEHSDYYTADASPLKHINEQLWWNYVSVTIEEGMGSHLMSTGWIVKKT